MTQVEVSSVSSDNDHEEDWNEDLDDPIEVKCLFCKDKFPSASVVFIHCAESHAFKFDEVKRNLKLHNFYDKVKLINYLRSEVKEGNVPLNIHREAFVNDDKYLKPVLEDDALLYGLHMKCDLLSTFIDLEDDEADNSDQHGDLETRLRNLELQFAEYKAVVQKTLHQPPIPEIALKPKSEDHDTLYFESYSYNDIHETMLKDSVRTEAYRDFIYDNKDLFTDKVVLDVGCGTGILSMFCAKAGARKVFAVDNSEIIYKARENVFQNGLDDRIVCLRGKIEEINLPVNQVDIIISEWMGYGLLYEAMLDSVLYARDQYLVPDGLMIPSECRLLMAAVYDEELINDKVNFWNNVYGFKMSGMKDKIHEEPVIDVLPKTLISHPSTFYTLELHDIPVSDLCFKSNFEITTKKGVLTSFVIWFDNYFMRNRRTRIPKDALAENYKGEGNAFTTGPFSTPTHWKQVILLIEGNGTEVHEGDIITGTVKYNKLTKNPREIVIDVNWSINRQTERHQVYYLR
ncbi:Ribosomal protein arginine N-methyltransferase rmt3 [Neolecta irregularis DAH-3]|uniref:type I protein arginine methyltransferase n=1 Tax=Neolecta irregularis (strain DAH-3) TaxID=1198029 RepID=A0A1U7LM81_NEOID|nr:Ribosomal protein arginine N-methyltransferase rmt3 [Neolecta irregularis DAH-3]|eukprot:OLL23621.1 Ribosomal protein arginine N-methyltransferase rmt3 [Neolecta irregularis DAH-3]